MLEIFTVAFFGHRYIDDFLKVECLLKEQIKKLIEEHEYVEFLVGRNGDFDRCASSSVLQVMKTCGDENCSLVLVLPYPTAEYLNNQDYFEAYYSTVEISYEASTAHLKSAIRIRNQQIADRADLILCYIEHSSGGAWNAVKHALKQGKTVINLADMSF